MCYICGKKQILGLTKRKLILPNKNFCDSCLELFETVDDVILILVKTSKVFSSINPVKSGKVYKTSKKYLKSICSSYIPDIALITKDQIKNIENKILINLKNNAKE